MKSNIKIRKAVKEDLRYIFQLDEDVFKPNNYPLFVLRQLYDILPNLFFVAVNELNQIKGYCFGAIDDNNKIGWVFALTVLKSEQNKKIGQRLTKEVLIAFKNKSINSIQLTTTPDNTSAINLYKKLGFKKVTEVADYYFDNTPRIIMKLETL